MILGWMRSVGSSRVSRFGPGREHARNGDPLLQGRLFSYQDRQLSRLGGPNFHQLAINAPKCPFANQQRDGHMQMQVPEGRVAYEPSSLAPDSARENPKLGFRSFAAEPVGAKGRICAESFADHYSQQRQFFRSQTAVEQVHIASSLVFELPKVETVYVREAMVGHRLRIDESLGQRVADGLGRDTLPSPAVSARLARAADHRQDERHAGGPRCRDPRQRRFRRGLGGSAAQALPSTQARTSRSSPRRSAAPRCPMAHC